MQAASGAGADFLKNQGPMRPGTMQGPDSRPVSVLRVQIFRPFMLLPAVHSVLAGGSYQLKATGGQTPYTWSITKDASGGAKITPDGLYTAGPKPSGLQADVIEVRDHRGFMRTASIASMGPLAMSSPSSRIRSSTSQTFTATGGGGAYTFSFVANMSGGSIDYATGSYTAGPDGGVTDVIRVTDVFGSTVETRVQIIAPIQMTPRHVELLKGEAQAFQFSGGIAPFKVSLLQNSSGGTVDNAGNYRAGSTDSVTDIVVVRNAEGQEGEARIDVRGPLAFTRSEYMAHVDGTIMLQTTGGIGIKSFKMLQNLGNGTVTPLIGQYFAGSQNLVERVQVTDARGQKAEAQINVRGLTLTPREASVMVGESLQFVADCPAHDDAVFGPITFGLRDQPNSGGKIDPKTGFYTAGMAAGATDFIFVKDGNRGNEYQAKINILPPFVVAGRTTGVAVGRTIMMAPWVSGGFTPYTYTIQSASPSGSISGDGRYKAGMTAGISEIVTIRDAHGHEADMQINVSPRLSVTPTTASVASGEELLLTVAGGVQPYRFSWQVNATSSSLRSEGARAFYKIGVTGGNAAKDIVRVNDAGGDSALVEITRIGIKIQPAEITVVSYGRIRFTMKPSSDKASYFFMGNMSNGSVNATTGEYQAGYRSDVTDIVEVSDGLGSTADATVKVVAPPSFKSTNLMIKGGGTLTLEPQGGLPPYTMVISQNNSGGTLDASGLYTAGMKMDLSDSITLTDSAGNTFSTLIKVIAPLAINPSETSVGGGQVVFLKASGGIPPYRFTRVTNVTLGSLEPIWGRYNAGRVEGGGVDVIRVTDAKGQTADARVTVVPLRITSPVTAARTRQTVQLTTVGGSGLKKWFIGTNMSNGTIDQTGLYTAGASAMPQNPDIINVEDAGQNQAQVRISVIAPLTLMPLSQSVMVGKKITFTLGAGSGSCSFVIAENKSGGSIDPTAGILSYNSNYTAGTTGNVTDLIRVTNAIGDIVEARVTVNPALAVAPSSAELVAGGAVTFAGSGGVPPYLFSLTTKNSGGSVDAKTGVYKAGATPAFDVVTVYDSGAINKVTARIDVRGPLAIAGGETSAAPGSTIRFVAMGGIGTRVFSLTTNGSGGTIDAGGFYTAGPTAADAVDMVRVTDSTGATSDAKVTVRPLVISPADTKVKSTSLANFSATGGDGKYTWSIVSNASHGSINMYGSYYAGLIASGTVSDIIQVKDGRGSAKTATVLVYSALNLSPATQSIMSGKTSAFSASGGFGTFVYSISDNKSGGTIDAASGLYTAGSVGGVTDIVKVTDATGASVRTQVTVWPTLTVSSRSADVIKSASRSFTANGGVASATFKFLENKSGGTIDASGRYKAGNTDGVTDVIQATDSGGNAIDIRVNVHPVLSILPTDSTVASLASFTLTANGGIGARSFSFSSNNSGGTIDASGLYKAGKVTTDVVDDVRVTDASGNTTDARITVKAYVAWPGPGSAPTSPVASMPFVIKASMVSNTVTPEFTWPDYSGAASYKIYISKRPFSVSNTIFAQEVSATSYQMTSLDGSQPLIDGFGYSFLVLPKDAAGKFLVTAPTGFLADFKVQLGAVERAATAGALEIVLANLNGIASTSFEKIAIIDREQAPDGTLTISGRVSNSTSVRAASISLDNGTTYQPITFNATTGDFTYTFTLQENRDYRCLFKFQLPDSAIIRKMDGDLEILRYINMTQLQQIKNLLDTVRDAYLQNDRAKLLSVIDRDYISKEPGFTDYQQFENTIRDQFNNTTTSFARWNSEQIDIVSPNRFLYVTFLWTQNVSFSRTGQTRNISGRSIRFDLRKVNGMWMVREDVDLKLFIKDFGLIPAPPN